MRLTTGDQDLVLGPEEAVLVPAGVAHAFTYLDGELAFLAIEGPAGWPEPAPRTRVVRSGGAWHFACALAGEVDRGAGADPALLAIARDGIAHELLRALRAPVPAGAPGDREVLRAVDRILRDYASPLRVEALAAELAISPRHFERRFKEAVGQGPKAFVIEVRLRAARELLAGTALPVAEVAARVGFSTPAHFAATFTMRVGTPPAAWRAAQKG